MSCCLVGSTPISFGGQRSPKIPGGEDAFTKFEANSTKAEVRKHLTEGFAYARMNGIVPPWST